MDRRTFITYLLIDFGFMFFYNCSRSAQPEPGRGGPVALPAQHHRRRHWPCRRARRPDRRHRRSVPAPAKSPATTDTLFASSVDRFVSLHV